MLRPKVIFQSVAIWTYLAVSIPVLTCVMAALWLVTVPFDRRRRACIAFGTLWANHYNLLSPFWTVEVAGRENIEPGGTYVFAANHQSLGDIAVLYGIRHHFKWVSKKSVFRVPFLGWAMWMQDHVALVRGHGPSIAQMMKECLVHLERGSSVMMFPEGTRSLDGRMRPFKQGAFRMAVRAGVPVVPIVVEGTRHALPKHGFWFRQRGTQKIVIRLLPPVRGSDPEVLEAEVRERMAAELARIRGVNPDEVVQA